MPDAAFTAEFLRSILDYDPLTGIFTWKRRVDARGHWNARWCGKPAGSIDPSTGYLKITIDRNNYYAHRLAWLYATGNWPADEIDHRGGKRPAADLSEIRPATRAENAANRGLSRRNTSGFKGVCWEKQTGRWKAEIQSGSKRINLGRFDTPEEAHAAYCEAARELHGEFARTA